MKKKPNLPTEKAVGSYYSRPMLLVDIELEDLLTLSNRLQDRDISHVVLKCVKSSLLQFIPASGVIYGNACKPSHLQLGEVKDSSKELQGGSVTTYTLNGSDVRGVAIEGEKGRTVDLTAAAVEAIAESFSEWVINGMETGRSVSVSVGRDPRISGSALSAAVFAGVSRAGCLVFDMGLATTPACFMSTVLSPFSYDASIMFFTKRGGLSSPEVEEICDRAAAKYANRVVKVSTLLRTPPSKVDFMGAYSKHLRDIIKQRINHPLHYDTPLQGFKTPNV
ncbi:phosphomannomutase/phosphoglucomutase isoform X3 [Cucumis melo var. makuwa]|uniref:Phosphomannomutase/phosphoglucomutase isoform X3 n=1 Tax=Cucumis melo var. makuwa TaxID=1194695 RepID=A0A5D3D9X3_CUCMM|nr:phosphomannomutase/phosphoglucomutase isoform X3 [Cucumis melo var. makuwa]